jgi:hypothetical protein
MTMIKISPELAGRINVAFQALERSENAAAMLGAILALRDLLRDEQVELADLGRWISDRATYEERLHADADDARCDVHQEVADADNAAAHGRSVCERGSQIGESSSS